MTVFLGIMLGIATGALASAVWILTTQMVDKHRMRRICQRVGHVGVYGICSRCDRWVYVGLIPCVNFHRGTPQPLPTTDDEISDRIDTMLKNVIADIARQGGRPWCPW